MVEHAAVNRVVVGSSPTGGVRNSSPVNKSLQGLVFVFRKPLAVPGSSEKALAMDRTVSYTHLDVYKRQLIKQSN